MTIDSTIGSFLRRNFPGGRGVKCKFCGSRDVVKYGRYQGIQRYFCKECNRKFADNDAPPHMKTPSFQMAMALNMFYEGKPICDIRRYIEQRYKNYPSTSTIYRWIVHFSEMAIEKSKTCRPQIGNLWIAAETPLKMRGEKWWVWDIVDSRTRFLLASCISRSRSMQNAQELMNQAAKKAGRLPRRVITNTLEAYLDKINSAAPQEDSQHGVFVVKQSRGMTEKVSKVLKYRAKVIQQAKKEEVSELLLNASLVHYNFFKPHKDLKYRTPAEKAGNGPLFDSWLSVVEEDSSP